MKIRKAKYKDLKQIISIVKKGLNEFGLTYAPETSESDIENLEATYFSNKGIFLVCDFNGEIIATGGLIRLNEERFKIRKMYVTKKHRGLGVSKLILAELENHAIKNKGKILVLETTKSMEAAIKLYESVGFKKDTSTIISPRCEISMTKKLTVKQ